MRKIYLIILLMALVIPLSMQGVTIYGHMTGSNDWKAVTGVYSFQPVKELTKTKVFTKTDWYGSGGCVYLDGKYYDINGSDLKIYIYDTTGDEWVQEGEPITITKNSVATDLTYDYTTGNVYGCFNDLSSGGYVFGTLDLSNGERTKIADLDQYFLAIASDKNGIIYGIGLDSNLYRIDKTTGARTLVGATGVDKLSRGYPQSAAFDLETNTLYWCHNTLSYTSFLYTVNIETGAAELITKFPGNERFVDIYIPSTAAHSDAPNVMSDFSVAFTGGTGDGKATFTLPTTTFAGAPLSGSVEWVIDVAGEEVCRGTGNPGDAVVKEFTTTKVGKVKVTATLYASNGRSSKTTNDCYVGMDAPVAVGDLQASASNGAVQLSWKAPQAGVNGGYVDYSKLVYKVTRQPEGVVCAEALVSTSFTETISDTQPQSIYYDVVPVVEGMAGEAASSNRVVVGEAFSVPFEETFDDANRFNLYDIIDGFNDKSTWRRFTNSSGNSYAACDYHSTNAKDEWLITPPVRLKKGTNYEFSFRAVSMLASFKEKLEVAFGQGATVEAMTTKIMEPALLDNKESGQWLTYSFTITVPADGDYNFGFHAVSDANKQTLGVDDIKIEGALFTAPKPVSDLKAVAEANGALSAKVSFKTPSQTVEGKAIDKLEKVEIYCNNRLTETIDNPAVGAELEATLQTVQGSNTVSVIAYNAEGGSIPATVNVYTGADMPGKMNVKVQVIDGKEVITWDNPQGANGGYVDPEGVSYAVWRIVDSDQTAIAADVVENTWTDDYTANVQTVVTYIVVGANTMGYGDTNVSNSVVVGGTPYTLPFAESFASGFAKYSIWGVVSNSGLGAWGIWNEKVANLAQPYDNDKGSINFVPNAIGDDCRLFSGNISMDGTANPVLEFYYYQRTSSNLLKVQVNPETKGWEDLQVIDFASSSDASEGWKKVSISLANYKDAAYLQIGFNATANDMLPIDVDNITLRDIYKNDLAVAMKTRERFELGKTYQVTATVQNIGQEDASGYTVDFYRDDELLQSIEGEPLAIDASKVYSIEQSINLGSADKYAYRVEVKYTADLHTANNVSQVDVVSVLPKYPGATELAGSVDGSVAKLSWNAPEAYVEPEAKAVTESFESYAPFTIDELGEWTLVDVDGASGTFGLLPLDFPYREKAKSFQVFNATYLGISTADESSSWRANSGEQMLISFADLDRQNDDWLISPALSRNAQTISFFVKSVTSTYGLETFEVMASSTGKELKDFTKVSSGEAPTEWTEMTANLPEGTTYFAIRCTSEDRFCMLLDDVTYEPGSGLPSNFALVGYNIYRDDVKVNTSIVKETSYEERLADTNVHRYAVTAVYDTEGESRYSNTVDLQGDGGVNDVASAAVRIYSQGENIVVEQASGLDITVYAPNGVALYQGKATGDKVVIPAEQGLYLVKAGSAVSKVAIK